MSDVETVKTALETCPDWEATRDANEALTRLVATARAEGFAKAREMAAEVMETWPHLSDGLSADYEDANTRAARRIRAMQDGTGSTS